MSITATEARAKLFPLIDQVDADQKAVEIVLKRGSAYLVPADECEPLLETLYLLSAPANAAWLHESIAEVDVGRTGAHDLIGP